MEIATRRSTKRRALCTQTLASNLTDAPHYSHRYTTPVRWSWEASTARPVKNESEDEQRWPSTAAAPLSLCYRRILVNHRRLLHTVTLRSIFATYDAGTYTFFASALASGPRTLPWPIVVYFLQAHATYVSQGKSVRNALRQNSKHGTVEASFVSILSSHSRGLRIPGERRVGTVLAGNDQLSADDAGASLLLPKFKARRWRIKSSKRFPGPTRFMSVATAALSQRSSATMKRLTNDTYDSVRQRAPQRHAGGDVSRPCSARLALQYIRRALYRATRRRPFRCIPSGVIRTPGQ
jgi:hypothetical protein